MKYELLELKNGLRIVLAPMPDTRTATVIVMTGTGSRYETERENGLAHFLEHMFFKGTKKRKSAKDISEELDAVGSSYNAFTAQDRTAYYAKVAAKDISTALDVISDIYINSTLPPKEIEKERGAVIQEIDMYEDMPMRAVGDVFDTLRYGSDHPLGRTILGPKENIRRFKKADFTSYLKRHYTPSNSVVCIAGSFEKKKVLAKIKKEFAPLKPGHPAQALPYHDAQTEARVAIKEKRTDQTQVMLGVPAYPYLHKDEYALTVLTTILGGSMSSRLFMEVREKRGLAYAIHAWTDKFFDTGTFVVQAGVEHAKLEEATRTILRELAKIKRTKVSAAELKKAKSYIKGTMTLSRETSDEVATAAASSVIRFGRVRPLEEVFKGIDAVSAADIQRVAKDLFKTKRLNFAVIGPHADAKKLQRLLKI